MLKARVDANQAEIVAALRNRGATVLILSRVGHDCPDLLIGVEGRNYLLEVKTDKGRLRPGQQRFFNEWQGHAAVVRSAEDALLECGFKEEQP